MISGCRSGLAPNVEGGGGLVQPSRWYLVMDSLGHITNPASPALTAPVKNTGGFQFTFVPAIGLTNSVETNSVVAGGTWGTLTNVPPPATASPVTVTDSFGGANRFYRVVIQP